MERVHSDGNWSLFCPTEVPGLADSWGEDFKRLYIRYEKEVNLTICLVTQKKGKREHFHFLVNRI